MSVWDYGESGGQCSQAVASISGGPGGRFARESGITKDDFHLDTRSTSGDIVSAVDGSNSMIIEGGSIVCRNRGVQDNLSAGTRTTALSLRSRRHDPSWSQPGHDFDELYHGTVSASFPTRGWTMPIPSGVCHPPRHAGILGCTGRLHNALPAGALLLLDGALRVSSQNHEPVLADIIKIARRTRGPPRGRGKTDPGHVGRRAPAPPGARRARGTVRHRRPVVDKDRSASP